MKGKKVHDVLNRLHLAMPTKRDQKVERRCLQQPHVVPQPSVCPLVKGLTLNISSCLQERPPFIPDGALTRRRAMEVDAPKRKLVQLIG